MKFLVLASCLSLSAAQGFFGLVGHPNGAVVPIDEPAVAAARADHLATKFGGVAHAAGHVAAVHHAAPAVHHVATPLAAAVAYPTYSYAPSYAYSGPLNLNTHLVAHPNGAVVPVDEPAVAAARADHLATKFGGVAAPVAVHAAPIAAVHHVAAPVAVAHPTYSYAPSYAYSGPLNLNTHLVAHPNGAVVPADEPAVVAARADHLAAHGSLYAGHAAVAAPGYPAYASGYAYSGPLNLNTHLVAHPNGAVVPVDEPAVQAARADHFAAGGGAVYAASAPFIAAAPVALGGVYAHAQPAFYGHGYAHGFAGLVAHPNGAVVPVDEPAVQAARADHFAARGAVVY